MQLFMASNHFLSRSALAHTTAVADDSTADNITPVRGPKGISLLVLLQWKRPTCMSALEEGSRRVC